MSEERVRCDHCGKWHLYGDLVMPHTSEEYQDGTFGVCSKCSTNTKYTVEYWDSWYVAKTAQWDNKNKYEYKK